MSVFVAVGERITWFPHDPGRRRRMSRDEPVMIVHYTRCWGCMMGQHFDPPQWHPWADAEDREAAKEAGSPDPIEQPCACACAGVRDSHVEFIYEAGDSL